MRLSVAPLSALAMIACAPEFAEQRTGDVTYTVEHSLTPSDGLRIGAFPWTLDSSPQFGPEYVSAPLDANPLGFEVASYDGEYGSIGDLTAVTGPGVLFFLAVYDDLDGSERHEDGEPIVAVSPNSLLQVESGVWYTVDLPDGIVATDTMTFGDPVNGVVLYEFAEPVGFPIGGTFHASMPPNAEIPLPATYVASMSLGEQELGKPLPGRPVDEPTNLADGTWAVEFLADPGDLFRAARTFPVPGVGTLGVEAIVAYFDTGDQTFTPHFGELAFHPNGMPVEDLVLGQGCYDGSAVFAVYLPVPTNLPDALVVWGGGGHTGWMLVTGLDGEELAMDPVPPEEFGALELVSGDCALQLAPPKE